jgi:transcriptional regulator with XRE-family HTH domain
MEGLARPWLLVSANKYSKWRMNMQLNERLRTIRKLKHMSREELAKRTGIHRDRLSYIERGRAVPTVKTLKKWAEALEIPLYKLFYEERGTPSRASLTIDWDAWFELSTLSKQLVDSLGLVGPALELAKNKGEAEQLTFLRAINDSSLEGHRALTRFAKLWASINEQACIEDMKISPEEVERVRKEARQNPIPRLRLRWSDMKTRMVQQAP